ncbi:MAG: hypothetical protein HOW73_40720 [Polyangiaceae bacterium]|nr:hypothetical protein [Polyangiaceae bacterium]
MRLIDSRVLAPDSTARRAIARVVANQAGSRGLLVFAAADTHVHWIATCSREVAGELARRIGGSLSKRLRLPVAFEASRFVPVWDQAHLTRAVLYVLRQREHHDVSADPTLDGTSLPDLLGWRLLGPNADAYVARTAALLPRLRRTDFLELAGLGELQPAAEARADLAEAAAAAFGLAEVSGITRAHVLAKRAAVHAGLRCDVHLDTIAASLRVCLRSAQRMRAEPADDGAVKAVGYQLAIRATLRRRGAEREQDVPLRRSA